LHLFRSQKPLYCIIVIRVIRQAVQIFAMSILLHRLHQASLTLPTIEGCIYSTGLLGIFVGLTLLIGLPTGYLQFKPLLLSWQTRLSIIVMTLFYPGIFEEVLFRALLLPHPLESVSIQIKWLWGGLSLVLFVLGHPLYGLVSKSSGLRKNSQHPIYLFIVGLLGLTCSIVYYQTGSLWTAVVLHWFVVVLWLLFFGGYTVVCARNPPVYLGKSS